MTNFRLLPLLGFVATISSFSTDPSPSGSTVFGVLPLPATGIDEVSEPEDCEAQAASSQSFRRPDTPRASSVIYDTSCAEDRVSEEPCMLHSAGTICTSMVLGECRSIMPWVHSSTVFCKVDLEQDLNDIKSGCRV